MKKFMKTFIAMLTMAILAISSSVATAVASDANFDNSSTYFCAYDDCCNFNFGHMRIFEEQHIVRTYEDINLDELCETAKRIAFLTNMDYTPHPYLTLDEIAPRQISCCWNMAVVVGSAWIVEHWRDPGGFCSRVVEERMIFCVTCGSIHGSQRLHFAGCGWFCRA